jgi:two-component system chemotaxis response regulator CheY
MYPASTRILIVDDSIAMRDFMRRILTALGFGKIEEADDGKTGFMALEEASAHGNPFGLVLSDSAMMNWGAIEFLKAVRAEARYAKLPFIVLSSDVERSVLIEFAQAGASNVIAKPFDEADLKAKLELTFKHWAPAVSP